MYDGTFTEVNGLVNGRHKDCVNARVGDYIVFVNTSLADKSVAGARSPCR